MTKVDEIRRLLDEGHTAYKIIQELYGPGATESKQRYVYQVAQNHRLKRMIAEAEMTAINSWKTTMPGRDEKIELIEELISVIQIPGATKVEQLQAGVEALERYEGKKARGPGLGEKAEA